MTARARLSFALPLVVGGALSCGGEEAPEARAPLSLSFALPIECAAAPDDLEAVAWVSGTREPTPLAVDVDADSTSGSLRVTTGAERRIVIDWFVERAGTRVLLAQAVETLDLTRPEAETLVLEVSPSDVEVAACNDVRDDLARVGSATTTFEGGERPACDLDASCGASVDVSCANLGELCAGQDPLREP